MEIDAIEIITKNILPIISICVAIFIYIKSKRKYSLNYFIKIIKFYDSPIEYKNTQYDYLEIISLVFMNTGNVPIKKSNIYKYISIRFDKPAIVDYQYSDELNGLEVFKKNEQELSFDFELVNPNDSFKVEILVNNKSEFEVIGKLESVKKINVTHKKNFGIRLAILFYLLVSIYVLWVLVFTFDPIFMNYYSLLVVQISRIAIIGTFIFSLYLAFSTNKKRVAIERQYLKRLIIK